VLELALSIDFSLASSKSSIGRRLSTDFNNILLKTSSVANYSFNSSLYVL